jgi:hypothetical protein
MEVDRQPPHGELDEQYMLALSPEAIEVLQVALDEAASYGRGQYIDTADLLIGLSQTGEIGEKLQELGVTVESIRGAKRELGGYEYFDRLQPTTDSTAITTWQQLPRTQRMHKIGMMVTESAVTRQRELVEPIDMITAITQEGYGLGARVLNHLGISRKMLLPVQQDITCDV